LKYNFPEEYNLPIEYFSEQSIVNNIVNCLSLNNDCLYYGEEDEQKQLEKEIAEYVIANANKIFNDETIKAAVSKYINDTQQNINDVKKVFNL
jgi:uncharacterized membrane-anchored protein YjiN (DUF445 family)